MPIYKYRARDTGLSIAKGVIEAANPQQAAASLRSRGLRVLEIREKGLSIIERAKQIFTLGKGASLKNLVVFSRQLSTLVTAGIPIVQSLNTLVIQEKDKGFRSIIERVRDDIKRGASIADALSVHPNAFSDFYVSMARSGEAGGILDEVLQRIADHLEAMEQLRRRVRSAMIYPATVFTIAMLIVLFLLIVVVPTFREIFESFGAQLPAPTRLLLSVSGFLQNYIIYLIPLPFALFFILYKLSKTGRGKEVFDKCLIHLPIVGPLIKKVAIAKFARTFGSLVRSGVPILEVLEIVAKTSGNKVIEKAVMESRTSIKEGERIAYPLAACGIFPQMVIQMIAVGEESGALDQMLTKVADFYDREVEAAIASLTSLIEPLLIIFLGGMVALILLAMFLPVFTMATLIKI